MLRILVSKLLQGSQGVILAGFHHFHLILYLLHSGRAISRVLYWTIIYLDLPLLTSSSDLPSGRQRATAFSPCLVLLRMGFTRPVCLHTAGELLPHHFNLTTALPVSAECFCCTFPIVTYAGRYPASLPCGARTFLIRRRGRTRPSALPENKAIIIN